MGEKWLEKKNLIHHYKFDFVLFTYNKSTWTCELSMKYHFAFSHLYSCMKQLLFSGVQVLQRVQVQEFHNKCKGQVGEDLCPKTKLFLPSFGVKHGMKLIGRCKQQSGLYMLKYSMRFKKDKVKKLAQDN
jgi:hypothetical protein